MKNIFIIAVFLLSLISCNKLGLKDKPIPVEQIFGTYDLKNGEKITLNEDFTYVRCFSKGDNVVSDTGVWYYHYFEPPLRLNLVKTFDMRALSEDGEKKYYTDYMTHSFYVCKHWGKIIITTGYAGDPDGAPALKWFKKVEE
jgi:hypothetical protein